MTTKQTIKAWKNAEFTANNSPVGTAQVDTSILAQVQGGQNNIVYTGCIPEPGVRFPRDCAQDDIMFAF
jgi:hypothetical protein